MMYLWNKICSLSTMGIAGSVLAAEKTDELYMPRFELKMRREKNWREDSCRILNEIEREERQRQKESQYTRKGYGCKQA